MDASDLKTEPSGTSSRTSLATRARQVESMAFPGTLKGRSLASSEGLKPVLIIPVAKEGFIFPSLSSFTFLEKVQVLLLILLSQLLSLVCSSRVLMMRLRALMKLMFTKSIELYLLWYSQANLRKEARESISNLRSQIALVANYLRFARSRVMPKNRVQVMSFRQKCLCVFGSSNNLKALVQESIIISSACMLRSPRPSYLIFGQFWVIFMQGRNWLVESLSHIAQMSPVIMQVLQLPAVRSKCCTVVLRVLGQEALNISNNLGSCVH